MPKVSLRNASTIEIAKWKIALNNLLIVYELDAVANDGEPPTREAATQLFPELGSAEIEEYYVEAM